MPSDIPGFAADLSDSHFALFGLPARFELDETELAMRYRELQRAVHPDRYAGGSPLERRLALQRAAQINEAFQVLKDPLRRARYLLSLHGVETGEESNTIMNPAFLSEQMALREALMELREAHEPQRELERIMLHIDERVHEMTGALRAHLADPSPEHLAEACHIIRKMQFLRRLAQEAGEIEEDLASA